MAIPEPEKIVLKQALCSPAPSIVAALDAASGTSCLQFDQVAAVADLNQDISASYTEAEIQAISDKVDELLAALRTAGILASS